MNNQVINKSIERENLHLMKGFMPNEGSRKLITFIEGSEEQTQFEEQLKKESQMKFEKKPTKSRVWPWKKNGTEEVKDEAKEEVEEYGCLNTTIILGTLEIRVYEKAVVIIRALASNLALEDIKNIIENKLFNKCS